jgi:hypothetical protein
MACVDEFHASDLVEAYGKMIADAERVAMLELKVKSLTETLNRHYTGSITFEAV